MKIDPEIAETVSEIIKDHLVVLEISYDWGTEFVSKCRSCGYFGNEDPALHTANVVLEYLEGYYEERYSKC